MMNQHHKIDYVEFPAKDLEASKAFFESAFGWAFVDYGSEYTSFSDVGLNGGFYRSDLTARAEQGSALVVLYSDALETTLARIVDLGGKLEKPIFLFQVGDVSISPNPAETSLRFGRIKIRMAGPWIKE